MDGNGLILYILSEYSGRGSLEINASEGIIANLRPGPITVHPCPITC